jgi:hypothetical protein
VRVRSDVVDTMNAIKLAIKDVSTYVLSSNWLSYDSMALGGSHFWGGGNVPRGATGEAPLSSLWNVCF